METKMLKIAETREGHKSTQIFTEILKALDKILDEQEIKDKIGDHVKKAIKKVDLLDIRDHTDVVLQNFRGQLSAMVSDKDREVYTVRYINKREFNVVASGVRDAIEIVSSLRGSDEELEEVVKAKDKENNLSIHIDN
jgi:hypothetical protein